MRIALAAARPLEGIRSEMAAERLADYTPPNARGCVMICWPSCARAREHGVKARA